MFVYCNGICIVCALVVVCWFVDAEQEGRMKFYGKCAYCIESNFDKN